MRIIDRHKREGVPSAKSIEYNYIMNTIIQGSAYVLPFIANPYVSGILGPEGMGKISFVTAFLSYFTMLAVLGAPTYGVREVSKEKYDKKQLSKTVYEILGINLIMGGVAYLIFYIVVMVSPQLLEYKKLLLIMSPTIILNIIGIDWMYKGLEEFSAIAGRNVIVKAAVIILIFLCIHNTEDLVLYGLLTVCAAYGANIWNFFGRKKHIYQYKADKLDMRRHFFPIFIFFGMTIATTIYTNLDMVMLGVMKNDYEAGIYDSAAKLKILLVSAVSSLGTVLLPRVTALINQGKISAFKRISGHALACIIIFSFSLVIYVEVHAASLVELFSGKAFYKSVPVLRILVPTIILIGITNIIGIQMLIPLGREKMVLASEIAGAIVDLLINIMLIPRYGALGAAIGTLAAEVMVLVVQIVSCIDYVKSMICNIQFYKILLSGMIAGLIIFLLDHFIVDIMWKLICSVIFFYLFFGVLLLMMKERESLWLIEKIKKRRKQDESIDDNSTIL